jgi:hypothetical protein
MCKVNIAAYDRRTLPHGICGRWHHNDIRIAVIFVAEPHASTSGGGTFRLTLDVYEA